MQPMIFVNLPVADLAASRRFFSGLGYAFNEHFCDEKALCLILSDTIFAMLLQRDFFQTFTPRSVVDAHAATEVLVCLSSPSRVAVDSLVEKALKLGASQVREPMVQGDFMYARSYADLDGHIWEIMWMDAAAAAKGCDSKQPAEQRA